MNLLEIIRKKVHRGELFKPMKILKKKNEAHSLTEFVHRINQKLPEDKNITKGQLSDYRNGVKSPSPEVRELMIEIMGEEAGAVYPWYERVVVPLRKQVKELQDAILDLSPRHFDFSWRREIFRAIRYMIIGAAILTWMFIYFYREPLINTVVRYYFRAYEERLTEKDDRIGELEKINDSKDSMIEELQKKLKKTRKGLVEKGELVRELEEKKKKAK